jgi:hypothetical protein
MISLSLTTCVGLWTVLILPWLFSFMFLLLRYLGHISVQFPFLALIVYLGYCSNQL